MSRYSDEEIKELLWQISVKIGTRKFKAMLVLMIERE